jgi:hypothetical protein
MNYDFDLAEWLPRFPLEETLSGCAITSPCEICNIERLRRGLRDQYEWGEGVPVDVFVMSDGEPEDRFATKIGGLPYRSRKLEWPSASTGRPLSLIAQFNFVDSLDIVGELPGDLLLVFGDNPDGPIEPLHMEWQTIGVKDLVRPSDIPSDCARIAPCFGNRCRMLSYPDAQRTTDSKYPRCHGKDVLSEYWILQLQATQIGRAPYFIQGRDDSPFGQPLCTISSVQPDLHGPYPFVNRQEPLCRDNQWSTDRGDLMIGDLGCIYIFIDDDGELHSFDSGF